MSKHTKLAEVARHAGVSTATVSRVLNSRLVKPATRSRVLQSMSELRYQPNLAARDLAGGSSRTIGVIVSNLENPFFFDIYRTLENDARAAGYEVVMAHTDYQPEQLVASIRLMIGRRVAGLAAVVSEIDEAVLEELRQSNVPAVFFDVEIPGRHITTIRVNYRAGIEKIVAHLHALGHRRLGFLGHHDVLAPLKERLNAVMDTVARYESLAVHSVEGADTLDGGYHSMKMLLASGFDPTAVICANDFTAVGALRWLLEDGIRVPQDISVVGFDNIRLSEFCYPPLTTIDIPRDFIGHIMFDRLIHQSDPSLPGGREIVIEPELLVRDSTGQAAKELGPRGRSSPRPPASEPPPADLESRPPAPEPPPAAIEPSPAVPELPPQLPPPPPSPGPPHSNPGLRPPKTWPAAIEPLPRVATPLNDDLSRRGSSLATHIPDRSDSIDT